MRLICPEEIITYYFDEINNESKAIRTIHAIRIRDLYSISVEKLQNGEFILVSGFSAYAAFRSIRPYTYIPVVEVPLTSDRERLIKILSISISLEKETSWLFKNEHVMRLIEDYGMEVHEIARETKQTRSTIAGYILDRRIPPHIRETVIERRAKTVVMSICTSTILTEEMRLILYERAVLPEDSPLRCNGRKFTLLIEFFSTVMNRMPRSLLDNEILLEQLIDTLIITDFSLYEHWNEIMDGFLERIPVTPGTL